MADDLHVVTVDLVAVQMVEVKVCVDYVANRLVGDLLQLPQQSPCGGWRDMRLHQEHIGLVDHDHGVTPGAQVAGLDRQVDVVRNRLELESSASVVGSGRWSGLCCWGFGDWLRTRDG